MKNWRLSLLVMATMSLAGCWQDKSTFEGKYFAAEGEECTEPSNSIDRQQYFLEITKQMHNGGAFYVAKFPVATRAGASIVSMNSASVTDNNELIFNFTKPEASGMFSGSPAVDIVIVVTPNKGKEGYLWLTKAELTSVRNGKVSETDLLSNLRKAIPIGKKGACLRRSTELR